MRSFGSGSLGAWTFFASSYPTDTCGTNGLPLTPNSIRILGRFQKLKMFYHPNLCHYVDILRGKHERLMVVSEHHPTNLWNEISVGATISSKVLAERAFQILDALDYLHNEGIVHRCLAPQNILLDAEGCVKLSNYGLYDMTECGTCVSFPIGIPKYMAPEVLAQDLATKEDHPTELCSTASHPKSDVWSLGIILIELLLGREVWPRCSLEDVFANILNMVKSGSGKDVVSELAGHDEVVQDPLLASFLESCLMPSTLQRPSAGRLLRHPFFQEQRRAKASRPTFPCKELRYKHLKLPESFQLIEKHLCHCPMEEVYYLWQLAGGDVEAELRRQGLIKTKPAILTLPNLVIEDGEEFGQKKDRAFLLNDTVVTLSMDQLQQRLSAVDPVVFYPLLESGPDGTNALTPSTPTQEATKLPLVIREKDIEYQLHRVVLFRHLLNAYPYKHPRILKEALIDIPPIYRAHIWASVLEIEGDVESVYDAIDKETPTPTDRQIEVDIPRCHQYDELLSSPTGHDKFKRILKAWVVSHPQYVYWQGLDSLCAPFLYLNFNDEALAYACLSAFIDKYLSNFFLKDNSQVIQEYLAVFSHLIAYHDPELTNHLDSIGFIPELYAIPWFLTMYTHVFPLHKIFHLWDTLLLGNSSFPLCIGLAILQQLRTNLLSFGFNECILLFSDMPEIDIERCVQDSIRIFCSTPKTAMFRQHERPLASSESPPPAEPSMTPLPISVLKSEVCPRISAEDLLGLMETGNSAKHRSRPKVKLLVVDVRPPEDFVRGSIPDSINIPHQSADAQLVASPEANTLKNHKGKMIVVTGSAKGSSATEVAHQLVRLGFPRVCTLDGGIDALKASGILTVRTGNI